MRGTRKTPVTVEPSRWVFGRRSQLSLAVTAFSPAPCTIRPTNG